MVASGSNTCATVADSSCAALTTRAAAAPSWPRTPLLKSTTCSVALPLLSSAGLFSSVSACPRLNCSPSCTTSAYPFMRPLRFVGPLRFTAFDRSVQRKKKEKKHSLFHLQLQCFHGLLLLLRLLRWLLLLLRRR